MKFIYYLLLLLVIAFAFSFACLNASSVDINYYLGKVSMPLSLALAIAIILGLLIGLIFNGFALIRYRIKQKYQQKKLTQLENELNQFKIIKKSPQTK